MTTLRAPGHLQAATKRWWRSVAVDYILEDHHRKLLTLAAESWDRCQQAREAVGVHGLTFTDRFGCPHSRPEIAVERDSRLAFCRILRELDLDVAPPPDSSRPPGLRSNNGG